MATDRTTKPTVIGLYGISGCGKTFLINQLKNHASALAFNINDFAFYDGSTVINEVVPGGFGSFQAFHPAEQAAYRGRAIKHIASECSKKGKVGVVAGHHLIWDKETDTKARVVGVDEDWEVYTHIVYLRVDAEVVLKRREGDESKKRPTISEMILTSWQKDEILALKKICFRRGILMTVVGEQSLNRMNAGKTVLQKISAMLQDFKIHDEEFNRWQAEKSLETTIAKAKPLDTFLVLDADRTLAPLDTGPLFFDVAHEITASNPQDPLQNLFKAWGYSYHSFRQASLHYEEHTDDFDDICNQVAPRVTLYTQMLTLLRKASQKPHVKIAIFTCGLRRVWELILARVGLSHIPVIGGGRLSETFVMTGTLKGQLVDKLHEKNFRVLAFGDSELDLDMLHQADQAYVVVGDEGSRSKAMELKLSHAIAQGLEAQQIVIPLTSKPRLDTSRLPLFELDDKQIEQLLGPCFIHATGKNSAKLLQTSTRNSSISGPDLRKAHEDVGWYLATEYITEILGLEVYNMPHVQGRTTEGHRLRDENKTLIIPLMRGGEPMAFGVSAAFKTSMFAHAKKPADLELIHELVKFSRAIILVDSVMNSGKSVIDFVRALRGETFRYKEDVVVVTGVVQKGAIDGGEFAEMLKKDGRIYLLALRVSENKYTGRGTTDTGHRLFNTTMLD